MKVSIVSVMIGESVNCSKARGRRKWKMEDEKYGYNESGQSSYEENGGASLVSVERSIHEPLV